LNAGLRRLRDWDLGFIMEVPGSISLGTWTPTHIAAVVAASWGVDVSSSRGENIGVSDSVGTPPPRVRTWNGGVGTRSIIN
jgi:hypothetical protein